MEPRWRSLLAGLLVLVGAHTSRAAMNLPDGIENILGFVPASSFRCERDGYFGDIDNDCRLFHLCQKQVHPGGRVEWRHWTYACGNQTMFNQLTLTCAFVDEAIPCRHASQFQYLNEVIHKPREPFLTDADVTSGISYYSNRIMSDGARARAYEDAQLMAQIGGSAPSYPSEPQSQAAPAPDELESRSSSSEPLSGIEETFRELANAGQSAPSSLLAGPSQPSSFSAPPSFDFSIATNHQLGPSNNLALELGLNHLQSLQQEQQQQQQQHFQNQQLHHPQAPPPPAPTEVKVTTRLPQMVVSIQPTTSSSLLTSPASTTPARQLSPETAATTTIKPLATTLLNALAASSSSSSPPPPSTTIIAPVAPVAQPQRPNQQTRRRQAASSSARTNQQLASRQQPAEFSHSPGFQSTRISRSRPTRQEAALVMRPAATTTTTTSSRTLATPTTTRQPLRAASQGAGGEPALGSLAFWRRPFDAHFVAPRFESLLTRRRV